MKTFMILLVTVLFSTAAFCQSTKTDTTIRKQTDSVPYASLYFYRSFVPKMNASLKKVPIYINDSLVHKLKANTMVQLKLYKAGKLNIAIDKEGESETTVKIKFGTAYFFRCDIEKGLWFGKPTIEAVTEKEGRADAGMLEHE